MLGIRVEGLIDVVSAMFIVGGTFLDFLTCI